MFALSNLHTIMVITNYCYNIQKYKNYKTLRGRQVKFYEQLYLFLMQKLLLQSAEVLLNLAYAQSNMFFLQLV